MTPWKKDSIYKWLLYHEEIQTTFFKQFNRRGGTQSLHREQESYYSEKITEGPKRGVLSEVKKVLGQWSKKNYKLRVLS